MHDISKHNMGNGARESHANVREFHSGGSVVIVHLLLLMLFMLLAIAGLRGRWTNETELLLCARKIC